MPDLYPHQDRWALGRGCTPGALHICRHTSGRLWVQNPACTTFYASYLLSRPLGRQLSETQGNPSMLWVQFLSHQALSFNPAWLMMSLHQGKCFSRLPVAHGKVLQRTRQNCWERHRISLMTRVPFPGSHTIPWPLPLCRRCPLCPVMAPAWRIVSVNKCSQVSPCQRALEDFVLSWLHAKGCSPFWTASTASPAAEPHPLNAPT